MRKKGFAGFAASLLGLINNAVMENTKAEFNYAEDGSKSSNKRKKVKLARKANLQRIKNER